MNPAASLDHGFDRDAGFELVHTDTLRFFTDLVASLGGDAAALLRRAGIDPMLFSQRRSSVTYRALVDLLEHAATELRRPDFGMRLAALQGGGRVFGPMGVVMKNSNTLGEALDYVARHIHAHSLAARMPLEPDRANQRLFVGFEILLDRLPDQRQAMEQMLLLANLNAIEITGGRARVREVRFRHQPMAPLRTYREHFGCEVRFDQKADGVLFSEQDLLCRIVDPDVQLYEMATSFIDTRFTRATPPMHARVRGLIQQSLGGEGCTNERVAAELCLHPRTLHRRLKAEGKSFEGIKDEVRRDVALRYLQQTDLPLTRIAEKLGYAETSVLSRSCFRWFGVSPRQLRANAEVEAPQPASAAQAPAWAPSRPQSQEPRAQHAGAAPFKVLVFLKRRAGLSRQEVGARWDGVRARLAEAYAGDACRRVRSNLAVTSDDDVRGVPEPDFDVLTELWFEDRIAAEAAARRVGRGETVDEERLFDPAKTRVAIVAEHEAG